MKVLSELRNDVLACERLFSFAFNKGKILSSEYDDLGQLTISGTFFWDISRVVSCKMFVWDDGSIFLEENGKETVIENIFLLVDFVRELGYEPQNN